MDPQKLECVLHRDKHDTLYSIGLFLFNLDVCFDGIKCLSEQPTRTHQSCDEVQECWQWVSNCGQHWKKEKPSEIFWLSSCMTKQHGWVIIHLLLCTLTYLPCLLHTLCFLIRHAHDLWPKLRRICLLQLVHHHDLFYPPSPDGARHFNIVQIVFCLHIRRSGKLRAQRGVDPPVSFLLALEGFFCDCFFSQVSKQPLRVDLSWWQNTSEFFLHGLSVPCRQNHRPKDKNKSQTSLTLTS